MQATIDLGDLGAIELPKKAIQKEGEQAYVLVNDFGTIIRRDVQVGQENGDKMAIESGLESADRVVISSKKPVKVGDIVESDAAIASDESATNESLTDASK
ncbi:efflux transporter [Enterococcus sp. AZ050]